MNICQNCGQKYDDGGLRFCGIECSQQWASSHPWENRGVPRNPLEGKTERTPCDGCLKPTLFYSTKEGPGGRGEAKVIRERHLCPHGKTCITASVYARGEWGYYDHRRFCPECAEQRWEKVVL